MPEIDDEAEVIDGESNFQFPWESEVTLADPLPLNGFSLTPKPSDTGIIRLRPYQKDAVDAIYAAWQQHQSILAVLATGLGKTVIAADVIHRWPGEGRILFIAHVRELIGQAKRKIFQHTEDMPEVEMGLASALNRSLIDRSKVVVASIQTMKNRKEKFNPNDFDLLMIDEAHHSSAGSYRELVQWLIDGNPNAKVLGITATPDRADGISLGSVFDHCAYEMGILEGIESGYLVPIKQRYFFVDGLDFSKCRTTKKSGESDFREDDLTSAMLGGKEVEGMSAEERQELIEKQEAMLHRVAAPTVKEAAGRPGIVYCVTVEHATRMAEVLRRYPGVTAEVIHAKTEERDRDDLLTRFKAGNLQFLVNVAIAVEGFDAPAAQIIVNARPTKSRAFYTQAIGRGTRAIDGLVDQFDTAEERREAIASSHKPWMEVFDFVGNSGKHKLVSTADVLAGDILEPFVKAAKEEAQDSGEAADIRALAWQKKKEHDAEVERRRIEEAEELAREESRRQAARQKEEERRSHIRAEAEYRDREINPFDVHERSADQRQQEFKGEASEAQYHFLGFLGMTLRNFMLTKKQAGRIIDQIQKGVPIDEVAYKNGIDAENWEPKGPSFKQVLALKGIDHSWVKSGADASALISAKKNVPEFEQRMLEDIHKASNPERLTHIGKLLVNVNKSVHLPPDTYGRIVAAGKMKRAGAVHNETPPDDF